MEALKRPHLFLVLLFLIARSEAQTVYRTEYYEQFRQPVYGYGYYHNSGYHGTTGPGYAYFYTPNYYVEPSKNWRSYPSVIYAPPVIHATPAPGMLQRQEDPPAPTNIYNNGPVAAYNEYPRTIVTDAMNRQGNRNDGD
jgi:hypothetical protein